MYFSLITPTPGYERDAAHEWTRGAYVEHQWLWQFLPAPAGTPRSFLFRRRDQDGLPRFYVVSDREPVAPTSSWQVQSKVYAPAFAPGSRLEFELRANPVVSTHNASGKTVRHDVVMQEKTRLLKERHLARWADWKTPDRPPLQDVIGRTCGEWFRARSERLGMALDADTPSVEGYDQHRGKNGEIRFSTVDLRGTFRVVDADALRSALYRGVGHAKAFGCGLLLIRPVS